MRAPPDPPPRGDRDGRPEAYGLWRRLDRQSPVASRLYEFPLVNFYSGTPMLRINYEKLAQFLPVKLERFRSGARRQLNAAFQLLELADVIDGVAWSDSKIRDLPKAVDRFCEEARDAGVATAVLSWPRK